MKKSFLTRWMVTAAAFFAVCLPLCAAQKMETVAVASFAGYDSVMQSAGKVAELLGQKDLFDTLLLMIDDVEGLDKTLPAGIAVTTNQSELFVVGFAPVADFDLLEGPGAEELKAHWDAENSLLTLGTEEKPFNLKLTFRDGWCLIAQDGKDYLPEGNPVDLLEGLDKEYLAGFRLYPDRIPAELMDTLLTPVRQQLADLDADSSLETSLESCLALASMTDSFSAGFKVDSVTGDIVFSYQETAKAGSELEKLYQSMEKPTSVWMDLYRPQESVFSFVALSQMIPSFTEKQKETCRQKIAEIQEWIDTEADENEPGVDSLKAGVALLGEFLEAELASGMSDSACSWPAAGPLEFGITLTDGEKLTAALDQFAVFWKEASEAAKAENAGNANDDELSADDVAELNKYFKNCKINGSDFAGYKVSTLTLALDEAVEMAGSDTPVDSVSILIGIKKTAAVMLIGFDKKKIAERFKAIAGTDRKPAPVPEQQFQFSLKNLAVFIRNVMPDADESIDSFLKILENGPDDAVITGGTVIQKKNAGMTASGQLTVSASLLKLAGALITEYQKDSDSSSDEDTDLFDSDGSL